MNMRLGHIRRTAFLAYQKTVGRVCFIHVNKCAGTTIERTLNIPKIHDTAQDRMEKLGSPAWKRITTFTVVRHPYARVVSHFNHRKKLGKTWLNGAELSLNEWIYQTHLERHPDLYDFPLMFEPCFNWVSNESHEVMVDYVLKVETLDESWEWFRKLKNLPPLRRRRNATQGVKVNDAVKLLSDCSLEIINQNFAVDFREFGYEKRREKITSLQN